MWFNDASEWGALAVALGFTPHQPVAGFGSDASFRQLKRSLGPVAGPPPRYEHWLRGRRSGRRCLVVHHIEGSGSHRTEWTTAVTEIDPPLFLGATISSEGFLARLFGGDDVKLGIPHIDEKLRLGALDPARLRELLLSGAGDPGLLATLPALVDRGIAVTDSTVRCSHRGYVTDPGVIARSLDECAWVASELGLRRAAMAVTPAEQAVRAQWSQFASSRGLTFDADRMHMHGVVAGAGVEVALETHGGQVHTAVGVRFPRSVGIQLHIRKVGAFAFLTRLFEQDIQTGDPMFDDAFLIQGQPEPYVRHVFASAALRATLVSVALAASELSMTHDGVFWLWPHATIGGAQLERHVDAAATATQALFGTVRESAPRD